MNIVKENTYKSVDRPLKDIVRTKHLISTVRGALAAAFLPSYDCLDIKEALKNGNINRKTFIIAFEREEKACHKIKEYLEANFDHYVIYNSEMIKVPIEDMKERLGNRKISYAFLDLCGTQSAETIVFIRNFIKSCFARKFHLAATYVLSPRYCGMFYKTELLDSDVLEQHETVFHFKDFTEKKHNPIMENETAPANATWNFFGFCISAFDKNYTNGSISVYRDTSTNMISLSATFSSAKKNKTQKDNTQEFLKFYKDEAEKICKPSSFQHIRTLQAA